MSMIGTKTPEEIKDYSLDWSKELGTDTISGSAYSTWQILPAGATVASSAVGNNGTLTTVWIADGTAKQIYSITNTIITTGGREFSKTLRLLVLANNYL